MEKLVRNTLKKKYVDIPSEEKTMPVYKDQARNTWTVKFAYKTWDKTKKWVTKRGFSTKREASSWEMECKTKVARSTDMTMNSYAEVYFMDLKARIKPSTFLNKKTMIEKWILPYLGDKRINEINTQDILRWQNELLSFHQENGDKLSKSYLKTIHSQITAMFNHAIKFYGLETNPATKVGNMGTDKEVKNSFWTQEQYKAFSEAIMDEPMFYYIFEVLYWCGLREGELLALTLDDINFKNKTIDINKTYYVLEGKEYITSPKTIESKRIITIPDFLCEDLKDYTQTIYGLEGNQRIFPASKSALYRAMKRGAAKANVPVIRIHDLRHSHVSLLINLGYSATAIAKRVGHSSVYITFHYAHLFPSIQQQMAQQLNNLKEGY